MNNIPEMNANTFPKYSLIRFSRLDIENDVNSITVVRDIHSNIGMLKNIKTQNKQTLRIEV